VIKGKLGKGQVLTVLPVLFLKSPPPEADKPCPSLRKRGTPPFVKGGREGFFQEIKRMPS
jgi:hypothetical protein